MSEGQGRRGGKGPKGRGKGGRRGKGRGRGNESRQSETSGSAPGGVQQQSQRDEERGATALPVEQRTQTESQQTEASSEQVSSGGETQQKITQTPKRHRQRKKHVEQTAEQRQGTSEVQPAPEQQPISQPAQPVSQQQVEAPTESPSLKPTERSIGMLSKIRYYSLYCNTDIKVKLYYALIYPFLTHVVMV